ncbi:MAG: serine hydrolase, partial [Ignavibacteria bacterium]
MQKRMFITVSILFLSLLITNCSENAPSEPVESSFICTITNPTDGSSISRENKVTITLDITSLSGSNSEIETLTDNVEFLIDGEVKFYDTEKPYEYTWDPSQESLGTHSIIAIVTDNNGANYSDSISIEVRSIIDAPENTGDGWETASLESVGLDPNRFISLMNNLNSTYNHLIHGIVVIKNNRLVFEEYFDGITHPTWGENSVSFNRDRLHVLSSVAKSFTATLVGIAIEKGFISSVDAKVFDFYPEFADLNTGQKQDITLRHLLTMSSGLSWDEQSLPLTDPDNDLTKFLDVALNSDDDLARYILELEMDAEPGQVFNYGGGNYNLLGDIIQRASGLRLDKFADNNLFEPLGIQESWWWLIRPDFVYASGDLALRHRDLAKVGQLYLQNGVWNGEQIIPEEWISNSST